MGVKVFLNDVEQQGEIRLKRVGDGGYSVEAVALENAAGAKASPVAELPSAPTDVRVTAGDATVSVAFKAPAITGGSSISKYVVESKPGGIKVEGPGSPISVGGLDNDKAYTFTVTAFNATGNSPPSAASGSVTPVAKP